MRQSLLLSFSLTACLAVPCLAKAGDDVEPGKRLEQTACVSCHSLRLIESQRLSKEAWRKEITKMIGWGALVSDQQVLIDYLAEHYSNTQPPPVAQRSADSK